jgi:hypothetical protein
MLNGRNRALFRGLPAVALVGFKISENAARGRKMLYVDGYYFTVSTGQGAVKMIS